MKDYHLSDDEVNLILKGLRCYECDMNRPRTWFNDNEIANLVQFIEDVRDGFTS